MKTHNINVNSDAYFNLNNGIEHYTSIIENGNKLYQFIINYNNFGILLRYMRKNEKITTRKDVH